MLGLHLAGPTPAGAQCITTLPVKFSFKSKFAAFYKKTLPVQVSTTGPAIRNVTAALYTFGGDLIARGNASGTISSSGTVNMRLRFPMQAGRFTLTLFGEPNADPSCGPKHLFQVVRFRNCITKLPVQFPARPGGSASAYGDQLSINVKSKNVLLRRVSVSLSSFDGTSFGSVNYGVLFGEVTPTFTIPGGLQPGSYTIFVRGNIPAQPRSCGPKTNKATLRFK